MIRLTVSYPCQADGRFDYNYYIETHIPLAIRRLGPYGLVRCEINRGVAGEPVPCVVVCHFIFRSLRDYQEALTANIKELSADVPKYTNIRPKVLVSEIASVIELGASVVR